MNNICISLLFYDNELFSTLCMKKVLLKHSMCRHNFLAFEISTGFRTNSVRLLWCLI